jgi:ABC-type uncharacterized transport system substrate-binding protein
MGIFDIKRFFMARRRDADAPSSAASRIQDNPPERVPVASHTWSYVFISYATSDKAVAEAICHRLEARGVRCWIAPRDVSPGTQFEQAIMDAVNNASLLTVVSSKSSNDSKHVENELRVAWKAGVPVIPFRIEDVPLSGVIINYISPTGGLDAMMGPLDKHIDELVQIIQAMMSKDVPPPAKASPDGPAGK